MKKTVKAYDIKRMVKMFNLSEDEEYVLNNIADDINEERRKSKYDTYLTFLMSPDCQTLNTERYVAVASLLLYFGMKTQEEVGHHFLETCTMLGLVLNADPQWIARIFRGMSYNKRFSKNVYVATNFGLNVLELYNNSK